MDNFVESEKAIKRIEAGQMKLTGYIYETELEPGEYYSEVRDAIVTDSKISLDWVEDGEEMCAVLFSDDGGTNYAGTYGSPKLDSNLRMEATRFDAKDGQVGLWLTWTCKELKSTGVSFVHLSSVWED